MRLLLLLLILWLPVKAETLGLLSQIGATQATFFEGSEAHTYEISPDLQRKLGQRGLGSLWEYNATPRLSSALDRGNDQNVQSALKTLSQFVGFVNQKHWAEAQALMASQAPQLAAFWSSHTLSPHRSDWSLQEVGPARLVVTIHSTQGAIYDEAGYGNEKPTPFANDFTLTLQGFRWSLAAYR